MLHHQADGIGPDLEFLLHEAQALFHILQGVVLYILIAEGQQPQQESVGAGQGGLILHHLVIGGVEVSIQLPQG